MKAYTNIEQSKKLAEILSLESADMRYAPFGDTHPWVWDGEVRLLEKDSVPCWSLAALLKCLSKIKPQVYTPILFPSESKWILQFAEYSHGNVCEVSCDNPVDACVEMIIKLHDQKLL